MPKKEKVYTERIAVRITRKEREFLESLMSDENETLSDTIRHVIHTLMSYAKAEKP